MTYDSSQCTIACTTLTVCPHGQGRIQNPNYVPVDWGGVTGDEAIARAAEALHDRRLLFGDPAPCGSSVAHDHHRWLEPLGAKECPGVITETATLNSAGDPIKVGDRVHHIADIGVEKRSVGVVTYVGPVEIQGGIVDNGARCRWDGGEKEESHHVDQLTVLL